MATTRDANVSLKVEGADQSKQDFEKVAAALDSMGDVGKVAGQGVTDALRNIETSQGKVNQKISEGRLVTERDGRLMIQQFSLLKEQIDKAFGSLSKAPVEIQQAFAKADAQVKGTTTTIAKLTDEVQDNKEKLKEGGVAWTGWGDQINKALGPLGKVQVQMMAVAGAFTAGWDTGQKLNKLFGTDMSEWNAKVAEFGSKLGAIIRALSDNVVAVMNVVAALWSRNWTEIKRSMSELADTGKATGKTLSDAATKWGDDWHREHKTVEEVAEAIKKAAEAAELLAERKKKLAEETRKLTAEIDKSEKGIAKETAEITKQTLAAMDASHVVNQRLSDEQHFSREITATTNALAQQKDAVARLTAEHGANDPMTLQAIDRQKQLEQELKRSGSQYDEAKKDVSEYQKRQDDSNKAIETAKGQLATLTAELKKQQTELQALPAHLDSVASATTAIGNAATTAAPMTAKLADGLKKTAEHAAPAAEAVKAATAAVTAFDVGPATAQWTAFDAVLARTVQHLHEIAASAPAAIHAVESLGEAAGKAAGTGAAGAAGGSVN